MHGDLFLALHQALCWRTILPTARDAPLLEKRGAPTAE